jgi:hypothetical protein
VYRGDEAPLDTDSSFTRADWECKDGVAVAEDGVAVAEEATRDGQLQLVAFGGSAQLLSASVYAMSDMWLPQQQCDAPAGAAVPPVSSAADGGCVAATAAAAAEVLQGLVAVEAAAMATVTAAAAAAAAAVPVVLPVGDVAVEAVTSCSPGYALGDLPVVPPLTPTGAAAVSVTAT